jgi:excinuclease ABC subunit A
VSGSLDVFEGSKDGRDPILAGIPGLVPAGAQDAIVVRGARTHNLRSVDVTIPRDRLVVITGPSGSGKSSLAFDTLYAEGQRRYVESLSAYARQFLDQLEKPDVDSVEGLSPALSIEQRSIGKSPRSTVGTVTEISDYLRLLYARAGEPYCHRCGLPISRQSVGQMTERVMALPEGARVQVLAPIVRGRQGSYKKEIDDLRRKGYVRARIDGAMRELTDDISLTRRKRHDIEVVVDRVVVQEKSRARLAASLETALRLAGGLIVILADRTGGEPDQQEWLLSSSNACADCGISYPELAPRMFSFNSPAGACPACDGLGVRRSFDPLLVVPDPGLALRVAVAPWQAKRTRRYYAQLISDVAEHLGVDPDRPLRHRGRGRLLGGAAAHPRWAAAQDPRQARLARRDRRSGAPRRIASGPLPDRAAVRGLRRCAAAHRGA